MQDPVAVKQLVAEYPDGSRRNAIVEIGKPYLRHRAEGGVAEWACPVSLSPVHPHLADMAGGDSLQALCLAISLAARLLSAFQEKGGRWLDADGGDLQLGALGIFAPGGIA